MKKRGKKLMLMAVVLLALMGGTLLAMKLNPESESVETEEESSVEATKLLDFQRSDISTLSWTVGEQTLSFHLENDRWIYDEDADFPANQNSLTGLVSSIIDLSSYNAIENVSDLAEYGLAEPGCTVTLGGAVDIQVLIGNATPMDSLRYISIGDGNVYMTDSSLLSEYTVSLMDLIELEEIPDMDEILTIEIRSADKHLVLEQREVTIPTESDEAEDTVQSQWYSITADSETLLDGSLASDFADTLSSLVWSGCTAYNVAEEELSLYGLDEPLIELTICYNNKDGALNVFSAGFSSTESSCYGRIAGSDRIYTVSSSYLDALLTTTADSLLPAAE